MHLIAGWLVWPSCAVFSGFDMNGLEANSKGRNLAAATAWLKQSNSQGHGFGIHR